MAGGTGGHVFPALAVALYLRSHEWNVRWMGTHKGIENRVVPENSIEMDYLTVEGIRGKGLWGSFSNATLIVKACLQSFRLFRKHKPDVVLGMGGYVAGPGGLMAKFMGIPLVIHEQNRIPGTTNRLLMHRATKVLQAFPNSFPASIAAITTGNPLRNHFLDFPERKFWSEDDPENKLKILVLGGSLGAKALNDVIPVVLSKLDGVEIKHQTGLAAYELVKKKYNEGKQDAQVLEFIDDIASAYQWANLVICRAGAMTISEIAAAGLPAILVPLPNAIDNHQVANAMYLVENGAAIILKQELLNEENLLKSIENIKLNMETMSKQASGLAKLEATATVVSICMEVAR